MPERHSANAPGDWYVDTRCIDCGAARDVAPGLIVDRGGQSVFERQPATEDERLAAWRARLLCPTASVHGERPVAAPAGAFPQELMPGVYRLGYNARSSFGAHSYGVRRTGGNLMVDAPRWTQQVVDAFEGWGGLAHVLLSHRDDVADAGKYARHFGARVWIHAADRDAAPYATDILSGSGRTAIAEDLQAIPVPGHTEGSVLYRFGRSVLFTGDSLAWSHERRRLTAFRDACWYSWEAQTRSLRGLLGTEFEWVLAGHGGSHHASAAELQAQLGALVAWMETR